MKRSNLSPKARLSLFLTSCGTCQSCQSKIHPGQKWEIDHIIPLALGGDNSLKNLQILCKICHTLKTNRQDLTIIAKVKRLQTKHLGANTIAYKPIPGSKKSKWKKKITGEVLMRKESGG